MRFWRDYAAWDGKAPFLSAHVAEARRNFTEMMLALAVLDLPFEAPKHTTKTRRRRSSRSPPAGRSSSFTSRSNPPARRADGSARRCS